MLMYCPKCQNLIDKTDDAKKNGETIIKKCSRCGSTVSFYIKYKAISSIINIDVAQKN